MKCQSLLDKASGKLAAAWTKARAKCEQNNAFEKNVPPLDCTTDPGGKIANARARAAAKIAKCEDFSGIPGCASAGSAAAVQLCIETAIGSLVDPFTEVAYQ